MYSMRLTKKQQAAIDFFELDFAKSDELGAGWFVYCDHEPLNGYPGSSCECIEDVVGWYEAAEHRVHPTGYAV